MPRARLIQRHRASTTLIVRALNAAAQRGYLEFGPHRVPCALGRAGVKALKREGDMATPRGRFRLRSVFYNPERGLRPRTRLALRPLRAIDGWCDSPLDRNYNRRVSLPYGASAERLWRDDDLYDLIVVLGHNDAPRIRNHGSAVFMHVARPSFLATEGCVALRASDLKRVLRAISRRSEIVIEI
jgi:L,D-peptidoglycan transpeptidase YkuD (ErfK/YbiS/YcfS/YnhG family)